MQLVTTDCLDERLANLTAPAAGNCSCSVVTNLTVTNGTLTLKQSNGTDVTTSIPEGIDSKVVNVTIANNTLNITQNGNGANFSVPLPSAIVPNSNVFEGDFVSASDSADASYTILRAGVSKFSQPVNLYSGRKVLGSASSPTITFANAISASPYKFSTVGNAHEGRISVDVDSAWHIIGEIVLTLNKPGVYTYDINDTLMVAGSSALYLIDSAAINYDIIGLGVNDLQIAHFSGKLDTLTKFSFLINKVVTLKAGIQYSPFIDGTYGVHSTSATDRTKLAIHAGASNFVFTNIP